MRAGIAALALFLLAACAGSSPPVASRSPVTSGTPEAPAASTPSPVASPSPSATPQIVPTALGLTLHCRLPLLWSADNGSGTQTEHAGFAAFPGQSVVEDTTAPSGSVFYDRAFLKWLPVWRDAVSPDGRFYAFTKLAGNAYSNSGSEVHVVDVASGADRVIYSGSLAFAVVDFEAGGVYVTSAVPEGYARGLWVLAVAGGQPRLISSSIVSPAVGGGAAWGLDFNAADPSPGPGGLEGPMNRVLRYDLATGASQAWFYQPGASLYVIGFDATGHPFVRSSVPVSGSAGFVDETEMWLVLSAGKATQLHGGDPSTYAPGDLGAVDSHGAWFSSGYGPNGASTVWLYTAGSMQAVAAVNFGQASIAGGCFP